MPTTAEDNVVLLGEIRRVRELVDPSTRLIPKRFEDAAEEFLAVHLATHRDRRSAPSNVRILRRFFSGKMLHEINATDLQEFVLQRLKDGVSGVSINRQRATLSKLFNWAIEAGYAITNPIARMKKFRESQGRTRFLTKEETERLLAACAPHLRAFVFTALYTGGRLSELLELRWQDVDFTTSRIVFRRETTKSARERAIPMAPPLASMLRSMSEARTHLACLNCEQDRVFTYEGRPFKNIRSSFETARTKAGLDDFHVHDLRHTFASNFVMNGGDIYLLQELLGHSTITLTRRYAHLSKDYVQRAVRFIGTPKD